MFQTVLCITLAFSAIDAIIRNDVIMLRRDLLSNYNVDIRPVLDQRKPVEVKLSYRMDMILDLDEKRQILTTGGWLSVTAEVIKWKHLQETSKNQVYGSGYNCTDFTLWMDEMLRWNASDYGGLEILSLKKKDVWIPDIAIENRVNSHSDLADNELILLVNSRGFVKMGPQIRIETSCDMDITAFPFDTQTCDINFTTRGSSARDVVVLSDDDRGIYIAETFRESGAWDVTYMHSRNIIIETCCYNFTHVTNTLELKRRRSFFIFNIIIPVVVLSFLNTAVFTLAPESGEKMTLSVTMFLSVGVFLTMISENMPKTSHNVSIMAVYMVILLAVSAAAIFLSALSLALYNKNPRQKMPPWLRWFYRHGRVTNQNPTIRSNTAQKVSDQHTKPGMIKDTAEAECSWKDFANALDTLLFWIFFAFTTVVTLVVFVMLTA